MRNNCITPDSQHKLCALLRYYRHGDFNSFCRAANLALCTDTSRYPFLSANLLLAYQIAGVCEISNATGLTEWWVSHSDDVRIRSDSPKEIMVSKQWVDSESGSASPLIIDSGGLPLILGTRNMDGDPFEQRSIFDRPIFEFVPAFRDIDRQLCAEAPISDGPTESVERYNCELGRWQTEHGDHRIDYSLSRVRKEYSGYTYYVQHDSVGVRFRIKQPEWAFVVAYHLLPWRLSYLFKVEGRTVRIKRMMRLPILILRALFAASKLVRIGPEIVFQDVSAECCRSLVAYFKEAGDRE